ncbi:MAG: hypothetical protein Q9M28_09330 [Mariprofundaceae bacterium]|nr:hypothetical protein [Mariprofundaceae bacterium]
MTRELDTLKKYLEYSCHKNKFSSCVVVGKDGLALCMVGDDMPEEFIAYLPGWLASGNKIGHYSGLGELACCCVVPKKSSSLMLVWEISCNHEYLYFAVLTPKLAADTIKTLTSIAERVRELIEPTI